MVSETAKELELFQICSELEQQELGASEGTVSPQVYGTLLCVYLNQNDLCNAKLLWKRIPQPLKLSHPELASIWGIGAKMWQRDFASVYEAADAVEWSNDRLKDLVSSLKISVRNRAVKLIGDAYSSISVDTFCLYVGMLLQQAIEFAQQLGWEYDPASNMIHPVIDKRVPENVPVPNQQHISRLTDFVSFLEN